MGEGQLTRRPLKMHEQFDFFSEFFLSLFGLVHLLGHKTYLLLLLLYLASCALPKKNQGYNNISLFFFLAIFLKWAREAVFGHNLSANKEQPKKK